MAIFYAFAALVLLLLSAALAPLGDPFNRAAVRNALSTPLRPAEPAPPSTSAPLSLREAAARRGVLLGAATEAVPLVLEPDYARHMAREFSLLTTENRLKFNIVHPQKHRFDFEQADFIVAFARANAMEVRGHCMIWHDMFPQWLARDVSTSEAEALVRDHIHTVMRRYAGRIRHWDIVNEPITDDGRMRVSGWSRLLGEDYIEKAYRWAREADPGARLFLNDYGIETVCPKSDRFFQLVQHLQARGVPLDGLGFQMHLNLAAGLSTTSLQQNLRRFAPLGLELHITEMDISLDRTGVTSRTLEQQAAMYQEVLRTALGFPQLKAVIFWGGADHHSWLTRKKGAPPDAPLLFDARLQPKPAWEAVLRTILDN